MFMGVAAHRAPTVSLLLQLPPRCNSGGDLLETTDFSQHRRSVVPHRSIRVCSVLWCGCSYSEDNVAAFFQAHVGKCNVKHPALTRGRYQRSSPVLLSCCLMLKNSFFLKSLFVETD